MHPRAPAAFLVGVRERALALLAALAVVAAGPAGAGRGCPDREPDPHRRPPGLRPRRHRLLRWRRPAAERVRHRSRAVLRRPRPRRDQQERDRHGRGGEDGLRREREAHSADEPHRAQALGRRPPLQVPRLRRPARPRAARLRPLEGAAAGARRRVHVGAAGRLPHDREPHGRRRHGERLRHRARPLRAHVPGDAAQDQRPGRAHGGRRLVGGQLEQDASRTWSPPSSGNARGGRPLGEGRLAHLHRAGTRHAPPAP